MSRTTDTYNLIKGYFAMDDGYNLYLTGSSALRLILLRTGLTDLVNDLPAPNDVDFLYVGKPTEIFRFKTIGDFVNPNPPHKSATFHHQNGQSFDLTMVPSVKSICIDGVNIICPKSLLSYYESDNDGIDPLSSDFNTRFKKINALKEAISVIEGSEELSDQLLYVDRRERMNGDDFSDVAKALVF